MWKVGALPPFNRYLLSSDARAVSVLLGRQLLANARKHFSVNSEVVFICEVRVINFYFGILLDTQQSCKSSTESSIILSTPVLLTSYVAMVRLAKLRN